MSDVMLPSALSSTALSLLPEGASLPHPLSAFALLAHTIHASISFRLVDPQPAEAGTNKLPENFDWRNPKFKYKHEQSALEFVVSLQELGGRAIVSAVAVADHKSKSFDVLLEDFFSTSAFPFTLSPEGPFSNAFASPTRFKDLVTLYRLNILQPLIPGLRKEGYSELPPSSSSSSSSSTNTGSSASSSGSASGSQGPQPRQPRGGPYYPDAPGPLGPYGGGVGGGGFGQPVGGFPRPMGGGNGRLGGVRDPFNIGRSDLDPLGGAFPHPHLPGFPGSSGPSFGGDFGGGSGGGGGMYVGPDHPLFRERFGRDNGAGVQGPTGPWGGDGYLPSGARPAGARFDPIGPINGPPQGGGTGIGGAGSGAGFNAPRRGDGEGPLAGLGVRDPDWDELQPPGNSGAESRPGAGNSGNEDWRNSMFG